MDDSVLNCCGAADDFLNIQESKLPCFDAGGASDSYQCEKHGNISVQTYYGKIRRRRTSYQCRNTAFRNRYERS